MTRSAQALVALLFLTSITFAQQNNAGTRRAQRDSDDPLNMNFDGARSEVYKTIGDVELKIYIFEPQGHNAEDSRPAAVFFFGGGWKSGSAKQFEQQCRYLASRGMVAMTADYRVASRQGTLAKECVQDGKSAIRWVRANSKRLGIDPHRIAAGGGSAGGHVAACTGIIAGWDEPGEETSVSSVPNAMLLFNPAAALAEVDGQPAIPADRAEDLEARCGTKPINLSPAHHVKAGAPPTILFFGSQDFLIEGARYFQSQMVTAGNRSELNLYTGQEHGFFNFGRGNNVYFEKTLREMDRFLVSLNYLEGPATVAEFMAGLPK